MSCDKDNSTLPSDVNEVPASQNGSKKLLQRSEAIDEDDLLEFIRETMNRSLKDRNIIFRIETDLIQFINDGRTSLPFPSMSSYHRMLVHRISTLFELDHNIDPIGNCVVVSKKPGAPGKLLPFRFKEMINNTSTQNIGQVTIIQREHSNQLKKDNESKVYQKKSFEERSLDYHRVRSRIFNNPPIKVESFDESNTRARKNLFINKASSFGGYSNSIDLPCSSISPASSGYKSLQQQLSTNTSNSSSQDIILHNNTPNNEHEQQNFYRLYPNQQNLLLQQSFNQQVHQNHQHQEQAQNMSQLPLQLPPSQIAPPQITQSQNMSGQSQIIYVPISSDLLSNQYYNFAPQMPPQPPPQQQQVLMLISPQQLSQLTSMNQIGPLSLPQNYQNVNPQIMPNVYQNIIPPQQQAPPLIHQQIYQSNTQYSSNGAGFYYYPHLPNNIPMNNIQNHQNQPWQIRNKFHSHRRNKY